MCDNKVIVEAKVLCKYNVNEFNSQLNIYIEKGFQPKGELTLINGQRMDSALSILMVKYAKDRNSK